MKRKTEKRRFPLRSLLAVAIIVILAVAIWQSNKPTKPASQPTSQATPQATFLFSEDEVKNLVNGLLEAVTPSKPENNYFTPLMQDKINWVWNEYAAGEIKLECVAVYAKNMDGTENRRVIASSGYYSVNGDSKAPYKPVIIIYGPRLMMLVRIQNRIFSGFDQKTKNTFALMVAQEAVHLEQPQAFYAEAEGNVAMHFDEEIRAHFIVGVGAVRQLRRIGQPLEVDYIEQDDALKECGYKKPCPQFRACLEREDKVPH